MPFPSTREELEAAGYRFDTMGRCRGTRCKADLYWWVTPKGKRIPLNADCSAHHFTCPDVAQFNTTKPRRR